MSDLSPDDLEAIARHGSSTLIRCLATVQLARRTNRLDAVQVRLDEAAEADQ